ncbi:rhodanese-like domain-containing protein [Actinospica robiniae]|uniref:rhodanese-like domain-containing protein n=1 Tax=Actinospica robiniae TaxID=304901 RepID=UPI001FDFC622|nr:rhodanese-like domain-containing protein [Actinospica robiniae]
MSATEAHSRASRGALLIDIRYEALRRRDGIIPHALIIERNELQWRLDPLCPYRLPQAEHHDVEVLVLCNEGYASSLAAADLQDLGLHRATDVVGGFQAWAAAGLPVSRPPTEENA